MRNYTKTLIFLSSFTLLAACGQTKDDASTSDLMVKVDPEADVNSFRGKVTFDIDDAREFEGNYDSFQIYADNFQKIDVQSFESKKLSIQTPSLSVSTSIRKDGQRQLLVTFGSGIVAAQEKIDADGFDKHIKLKHIDISTFKIHGRDGAIEKASLTYYSITVLDARIWDRITQQTEKSNKDIAKGYFTDKGIGFDVPAGYRYRVDTYAYSQSWKEYVYDSTTLDLTK